MKNRRVGVLMGGRGIEHDMSLRTGEAVASALEGRGHDVVRVVWHGREFGLDELLRGVRIDVAFIALRGRAIEDGCVQGMLELMGIPYTGSGVLSSALSMDNLKAKEMFRLHNVPTPPYYVATSAEAIANASASIETADLESMHGTFGFPVVVKPRRGQSPSGMGHVAGPAALRNALEQAFALDNTAIVERHVGATSVYVGIVHERVLGIVETETACAPRLPPTRLRGVANLGLRAVRALSCSGACGVDVLVTEGENEYVLGVRTQPGMMPTSLLPIIAANAGLDYPSLCESMLEGAGPCSTAQLVRPVAA